MSGEQRQFFSRPFSCIFRVETVLTKKVVKNSFQPKVDIRGKMAILELHSTTTNTHKLENKLAQRVHSIIRQDVSSFSTHVCHSVLRENLTLISNINKSLIFDTLWVLGLIPYTQNFPPLGLPLPFTLHWCILLLIEFP